MHQPADVDGELLRRGAGQQHALLERVEEALLAQPAAALDQLAVHDGYLPGGAAERNPAELDPEAQSLRESDATRGPRVVSHAAPKPRPRARGSVGGRR